MCTHDQLNPVTGPYHALTKFLAQAKPVDAGPVGQHKAVKRSRCELLEQPCSAAPWASSKKAINAAMAQQTADVKAAKKTAAQLEKKGSSKKAVKAAKKKLEKKNKESKGHCRKCSSW